MEGPKLEVPTHIHNIILCLRTPKTGQQFLEAFTWELLTDFGRVEWVGVGSKKEEYLSHPNLGTPSSFGIRRDLLDLYYTADSRNPSL